MALTAVFIAVTCALVRGLKLPKRTVIFIIVYFPSVVMFYVFIISHVKGQKRPLTLCRLIPLPPLFATKNSSKTYKNLMSAGDIKSNMLLSGRGTTMSSHLSSIRLRISSNTNYLVAFLCLSHDTYSSNILSFWAVLLLLPPYIFIISSLVGQIWTISFFHYGKNEMEHLNPHPI